MDTFDYQRSSVPARLPAARGSAVPIQRLETTPVEATASPISLRSIARASRRYWWLILALWAVGSAGISAVVYLKVRPLYSAMSLLKVDPNMLDLYGGGGSSQGGEPYMQTHVELIRSPTVLSAAAHDERINNLPRIKYAGDAIQELTKAVQVGIRPSTHLIEVSMMSPSGDEASNIVNAVVDAFLFANKGWSNQSAKNQISKLKVYYDELQVNIKRTENEIKMATARGAKLMTERLVHDGKADNTPADRAIEVNLDVAHFHKMMSECQNVKTNLVMAEAKLLNARQIAEDASLNANLVGATPPSAAKLKQRINSDPEMLNLLKQQQTVYDRWKKASGNARNQQGDAAAVAASKSYFSLKDQISRLQDRKEKEYQAELAAEPLALGTGPDAEVRRIQAEVQQLTVQRDALDSQVKNLKVESNKQHTEEVEVRFLAEEHQALMANSDVIRRRLDQLNFDQTDDERINCLAKARAEGRPISDKRVQYLAMTPVGVLAAVLALVVLLEIRSGRVADPEFLSSRMRHEVFSIAPLPSVRTGIGSDNNKAEQRLARFVQSLDHLRVALCEGGTNGDGRCVMITSATGGEGKTTLSAHLAARCANAGTSTLLIDADLRRASLGRLLDVPAGMGLGDVLAGQAELDENLVSVQAGGFHFLSAGTPGIDPTRVLKSTRLAELIGQLRQMYDLIIIDTPPVLPVADALIMGRWADGAVMAARYDASRLPLVERANRQIIAAGIPVLGVVVNGVRGHDETYGNYAYNYSYPGQRETSDDPVNAS